MTFVDSNVLIDLATDDPVWADWSEGQLEAAAARGALAINGIVYAELSAGFARVEECDAFVAAAGLEMVETPRAALFLAAQAHKLYRARGGTRTGVLPDFLIGAHAAVEGAPLLTRDTRRHRAHFPRLRLIAPEGT